MASKREEDGEGKELTAAERVRLKEQAYMEKIAAAEEAAAARERAAARDELRKMRAQEMHQCSFDDRFWGLDFKAYELEREEWERQLMAVEDDAHEAVRARERQKNDEEAAAYARWRANQHALELQREHHETVAMATEEGLQTAIDRFWGVDTYEKERRVRAEARLKRDEARRIEAKAAKLKALQDEWTKKGQEMQRRKRLEEARTHELVRQEYMSMFFSATSSADVIQFHWPTFTNAEAQLQQAPQLPPPSFPGDLPSAATLAATPASVHSSGGGGAGGGGGGIRGTGSVRARTRRARHRGFDMGVVYAPERVQSPVHVLHKLNPVKTVGKRHLELASDASHFQLVPDLRPGNGPGVPPVEFKSTTKPPRAMMRDVKKKAAATRAARRGSTTRGGMQWPVPSKAARAARNLTVRGWVVAAAHALRHLDRPQRMAAVAHKYSRIYCALWRQSALYFFESAADSRAFFNSAGQVSNTCCGFIDLESVVSVRERLPTQVQKRRREAAAQRQRQRQQQAEEEAAKGKPSADDEKQGEDSSLESLGSISDSELMDDGDGNAAGDSNGNGNGDGNSNGGDGDGEGAAGPAGEGEGAAVGEGEEEGKKEAEGEDEPEQWPFRVLEIVGIGETYYLVPDGGDAEEAATKRLAELKLERATVKDGYNALLLDAKTKEAASAAAEKKGPREGNYKLKIKAQGARAKADAATRKLAALDEQVAKAETKAAHARDAWFELWRNVISRGVAARNAEVAMMTQDQELLRSGALPQSKAQLVPSGSGAGAGGGDEEDAQGLQSIEPSRLHEDTAALIRAVGQSKLGPWAAPVELMGKVETLIHQYKMRMAGLASGSPLAQLRAIHAGVGDAASAGLQKGRVHSLSDEFGFLRPEDVTGDRDVYFRRSDAFDGIAVGDQVTYDTVRDERGMSKKDMRAVNIRRQPVQPYVGYEDLDTMPWQPTNAARVWCTESIARTSSRKNLRRSASGEDVSGGGANGVVTSDGAATPAPASNGPSGQPTSLPQQSPPASTSTTPGKRRRGRGKRKGRGTGGRLLRVSPVRSQASDNSRGAGAIATTPGGSVLPRLNSGDPAMPSWNATGPERGSSATGIDGAASPLDKYRARQRALRNGGGGGPAGAHQQPPHSAGSDGGKVRRSRRSGKSRGRKAAGKPVVTRGGPRTGVRRRPGEGDAAERLPRLRRGQLVQ